MLRGLNRTGARRAVTLIELLVVVAIIATLIGFGLPAILAARSSVRRMQCQSQLRQVGLALTNYLDAHGGSRARYPFAAQVPSINSPNYPSIVVVLGDFIEDNKEAFNCPSDLFRFPKEGTSYEYPLGMLGGKTRKQALMRRNGTAEESSTRVMIMWEFDPFHGTALTEPYVPTTDLWDGTTGDPGTRNFLFADGHVDCP